MIFFDKCNAIHRCINHALLPATSASAKLLQAILSPPQSSSTPMQKSHCQFLTSRPMTFHRKHCTSLLNALPHVTMLIETECTKKQTHWRLLRAGSKVRIIPSPKSLLFNTQTPLIQNHHPRSSRSIPRAKRSSFSG